MVYGDLPAVLALPIVIYFWKVILWDKVLALGTTDRSPA